MSTNQLLLTKTNQKIKTHTQTKTCITTEQSQKLVQTMLTMSFGCLTFLRGLFPDDYFLDQRFVPEKCEKNYNKNSTSPQNSIKIKTLVRGKSNEVDLLLNWLEKGVFQSIKLKYLRGLSLGIFLHEDNPNDLVENYIFSFDYDQFNNVTLKINESQNNSNEINNAHDKSLNNEVISLLDSRKMVQQLMRRFIIITQSLEPLPNKKFLNMKLIFNGSVKDDYQPLYFRDATYEPGATMKLPLKKNIDSMNVGNLNTNFHNLNINIFSRFDSTNDSDLFYPDNINNPSIDHQIVDLFEQVFGNRENMSIAKYQLNKQSQSQSQITNNLDEFLNPSADSILPTQLKKNGLNCECNLSKSTLGDIIKNCKQCNKNVHGLCYGNIASKRIICLQCIYDNNLDVHDDNFKKLMTVRKLYRGICKIRGSLPSSITQFSKSLVKEDEITKEIQENLIFAISMLFHDKILTLTNIDYSKPRKIKESLVTIDIPGIIVDKTIELQKDKQYSISFSYKTSFAHSCYLEDVATTKNTIDTWLMEIGDFKLSLLKTSPPVIDLQSLIIDDTETQDQISTGCKRKNLDLDQYLKVDESSIVADTINVRENITPHPPPKIRRISVSKKSLRSNW